MTRTAAPLVTVLIPARNEAADIARCLQAVLDQDHPHDRMEIILVDGESDDGTADVAADVFVRGDIQWQIIQNLEGTTPSNLNAGLAAATGDLLCRVDARSIIPPHYVRLSAEVLSACPDVAVTGGAQVALALDGSPAALGIARALNNRYAMGGAPYRSNASSGPSDTVYLGSFRTAELRSAGGWDSALLTNQDYELNRRMGRHGLVWFDSRLRVGYVPRRSLSGLWTQYHRFGRWKVRYWRHTTDRPQPRQWLLLGLGSTGLLAVAGLLVLPGPRGRRALTAAAATTGLLVLADERGSAGPHGGAVPRATAAAAMVTTSAAWTTGVLREAAFGSHSWLAGSLSREAAWVGVVGRASAWTRASPRSRGH